MNRCYEANELLWQQQGDWTTLTPVWLMFSLLYLITFTLGVCGNAFVISAILPNKKLRSVRNLFIVSLSISDMLVSIFSNLITPVAALAKVWYFGTALCYIFPLVQGMCVCISTFTLVAISLDRLILVVFPTQTPINQFQAILISCAVWLISLLIATPNIIHQKIIQQEAICGRFCTEIWSNDMAKAFYGVAVAVLIYLLPIVVISVCYTCIFIRLSKRPTNKSAAGSTIPASQHLQQQLASQQTRASLLTYSTVDVETPTMTRCSLDTQRPSAAGGSQQQTAQALLLAQRRLSAQRRRSRTNRMLVGMVCAFALSMFSFNCFNLLRDLNSLPKFVERQSYFFGLLTHWLAMTSTVWNPLLYAWLNKQLRCGLLEIMPCKRLFNSSAAANQPTNRHKDLVGANKNGTRLSVDPAELTALVDRKRNKLTVARMSQPSSSTMTSPERRLYRPRIGTNQSMPLPISRRMNRQSQQLDSSSNSLTPSPKPPNKGFGDSRSFSLEDQLRQDSIVVVTLSEEKESEKGVAEEEEAPGAVLRTCYGRGGYAIHIQQV